MITIDRESPLPLYYQLKQLIVDKLDSGEWKPGDLVPSEQELQETYGLSRTTVRQALAELTFEGRFTRHRGQGTFVAAREIVHDPMERISITALMRQQGIEPEWQFLSRGNGVPFQQVQEALGIPEDEKVYLVELLLRANGEPIGRHFVALTRHGKFDPDNASDEALRDYMRELPDRDGIRIRRTVQAVPAGTTEAGLLKIKPGEPVLSIQVVYSDSAGKPLEFLRANYRGDRFKFQLNI